MSSSRTVSILAAVSLLSLLSLVEVAAAAPPFGCHSQVFDARHMRAHPGRIVRKVTLDIAPPRPEQLASGPTQIISTAHLRMWAKGSRAVFESFGVCSEVAAGFECIGHDKANEHITCKTGTPGVHKCRTPARAETFRLERRPEGVLVTIPIGLELDAGETGPYLNLMASDRENSAFLVTVARSCR